MLKALPFMRVCAPKGVSGVSHERGGGSADGLMADVRIAIRRTSLCAPTECIFCPEWDCRMAALYAVCKAVIAAVFSRSNYTNSAGICYAVFGQNAPPDTVL